MQEVRLADSLGFLGLYLVYIGVVLVGRWLHTRNRQDVPYGRQQELEEEQQEQQEQQEVTTRPVVTGDPPEIQLMAESRNQASVKDNLRYGVHHTLMWT